MVVENHKDEINFKLYIFYAGSFFIFLSFFSLLFTNFIRSGLDVFNSLNLFLIFYIVGIFSSFLVFLNKEYIQNKKFYFFKTSYLVLAVFVLPLSSFISNYFFFLAISLVIIIGLYNIKFFYNKIKIKTFLLIAILASASLVLIIPWKIGYYFSPELTLYGLTDNQTLQGAAISNIFKNYGVISMGVDGVENGVYKYHYGLYVWWAAISNLTDQATLIVIPYTQLSILAPLLFICSFIASSSFINKYKFYNINNILLFIFIFVIFDSLSGKLHYDSETYTSSLIFLILLIPTLNYLIEKKLNLKLLLFLFCMIPVISSLKLTTGYLLCILLSLIIFYRSKKLIYNFIYATIIIFFGLLSVKFFMPSSYTGMDFWRAYTSYGQLFRYELLISIFAILILFLGLFLKIHKLKNNLIFSSRLLKINFNNLYRWLKFKNATYPKIIIITCVLSIFPVLIFPVGSTGVYNIIQLFWLILPILFIKILKYVSFEKTNYILTIILIILSINIIIKPTNIDHLTLQKFYSYTSESQNLSPRQVMLMIFNNIKTNKTLFSEQQKKNIQNNNLNLIIKKINNYKDKYKNISIYIPKYNEEFWHIIKKNNKSYWCSSTSFLIPALSGVSKIKGLQDPNLCETYYIAGPSEYSSDAYLSNLNDSEICLYARKRSIEYIYKFNSIDNEKDNILLSCKIS